MRSLMFAIFAILLLLPLVIAEFDAKVYFEPTTWPFNITQKVKVMVVNDIKSKYNLVKIEIIVPTKENVPIYLVADDFTLPAGWTYSLSYKVGRIYKITFSSAIGIEPGKNATFMLNSVRAPEKPGEYEWKWEAISTIGEKVEGKIKTLASFGKLSKFVIEKVPEEIIAGKTFEATIKAYDEFGHLKEDYVERVFFTSTDKKAIIPPFYDFKLADKGKIKINITYVTKGDQYFTVSDIKANISTVSPKTIVLPAIPRNLKIEINKGALFTTNVSVILTLSAENAEECRYSNDATTWSPYEKFAKEKEWKIIPGEGMRIVYYQCRNVEGESEIVSDSIELRLIPFLPVIPPTILSFAAIGISIVSLIISLRKREVKRKEE